MLSPIWLIGLGKNSLSGIIDHKPAYHKSGKLGDRSKSVGHLAPVWDSREASVEAEINPSHPSSVQWDAIGNEQADAIPSTPHNVRFAYQPQAICYDFPCKAFFSSNLR